MRISDWSSDVCSSDLPLVLDRRLVVHRVVRVVRAGEHPVVQTGGDANDAPDPWLARLPDGAVWPVRAEVPHLGHVLLLLRTPPGPCGDSAARTSVVSGKGVYGRLESVVHRVLK